MMKKYSLFFLYSKRERERDTHFTKTLCKTMNLKRKVKQTNEESKSLVKGWMRKCVPSLTIPIQLIYIVILYYFEECKFSKCGMDGDIDCWNFTNYDRTVTKLYDSLRSYGEKVKLDYTFGAVIPFRGVWRYRIEKCIGGQMVFTILNTVNGSTIYCLDCLKKRPFMNLIKWDIVEVWVIIEKERKEIGLNCISPGNDDETFVYPAYHYEKGRLYTPYIYLYNAKDSVTLINFQSGTHIQIPEHPNKRSW